MAGPGFVGDVPMSDAELVARTIAGFVGRVREPAALAASLPARAVCGSSIGCTAQGCQLCQRCTGSGFSAATSSVDQLSMTSSDCVRATAAIGIAISRLAQR